MGHRHFFNPSYMLETENDESWNLTEHPYMHSVRSGAGEGSSLTYPADNMSVDGAQYASHCNHTPLSSGYSSLPHNLPNPDYQQDAAGPSNRPTHPSAIGAFYTVPESYRNHASSSNYNGNPFNEEDLFDIRVGDGRCQYKRKSPGVPAGCERDSTNRHNDPGSSSDVSMPTDPWQETPTINSLRTPWDHLSIGGESSLRNVRSRAALDLETNFASTHLARDYYTTSRPMDFSSSGQNSNGLTRDWNPIHMPSATHGNGSLHHDSNPFVESSNPSNLVEEVGRDNNDVITSSSSHGPQNLRGNESVRGVGSGHIQRPAASTFRLSSRSLRLGHTVAADEEGLRLANDSYSSRNPRLSSAGWRARMLSERYQSFSEANFHGRSAAPEGLTIVDRSGFYGSRHPLDQHREMRLDIDDMSYEELLALGERIGSVGTGLSEDLISKCLRESVYCSSDQLQDEGSCVICLEEYANMDDVGMLKGCGHDFHVGCIRKWLSMKNLCPICKSEPIKHR